MGFFSDLFLASKSSRLDNIPSIMPEGAINQINMGILPTMNTHRIMLAKEEKCHFAERAILITEKVSKHYVGKNNGYSIKLTRHVTYRTGRSRGTPVEDVTQEKTKGLLYITDRRVVFVADKNAFDKKLASLTACVPYTNAIKLQFGTKTYTLMVPDSEAMGNTITLINNL